MRQHLNVKLPKNVLCASLRLARVHASTACVLACVQERMHACPAALAQECVCLCGCMCACVYLCVRYSSLCAGRPSSAGPGRCSLAPVVKWRTGRLRGPNGSLGPTACSPAHNPCQSPSIRARPQSDPGTSPQNTSITDLFTARETPVWLLEGCRKSHS